MFQETKLKETSDLTVKKIWGRRQVNWVAPDAVGALGGLLVMWDPGYVAVSNSLVNEFSVSVLIEDLVENVRWLLTFVYGPNDGQRRKVFCKEMDMIRGRRNGAWCVGGDWNVIRFPWREIGMMQNFRRYEIFLRLDKLAFFCGSSPEWGFFHVVDTHQNPPIMSRLDRFLVSNDWVDMYPDVVLSTLPKPASDHCPIMFDSNCERWVPAPFLFELMWSEEKEILNLISDWWKVLQVEGWPGQRLALKIKLMNRKITDWAKGNFGDVEAL
ncbi:hypothetical protein AAC387_Pa11g0748 [Persea americana]